MSVLALALLSAAGVVILWGVAGIIFMIHEARRITRK